MIAQRCRPVLCRYGHPAAQSPGVAAAGARHFVLPAREALWPQPTVKNTIKSMGDKPPLASAARGLGSRSAARGAITDDEFAVACAEAGLESSARVLVALSGGVDSVALCWLSARRFSRTSAVVVDHTLRTESTAEAKHVAALARGMPGVFRADVTTVTWGGSGCGGGGGGFDGVGAPRTGVQASARAARYELLDHWARANDCTAILTAHHLDDQIETLLLRIGMCTGLEGLGGIRRRHSLTSGTVVARPLLGFPKRRLEDTCRVHGLEVVEDPSNRSMKYTRNAVRATVRRLSDADPNLAEGLSIACKHAEELAADARRAGEACFSDTATLDSDSGHAIVDLNALRVHGAASQASTLCRAIQVVTGSNAQASLDTVRQVVDGVLSDGSLTMAPEPRVVATIGGAVFVRAGKSPNTLIVTRQPPRASDHRSSRVEVAREEVVWDRRFVFWLDNAKAGPNPSAAVRFYCPNTDSKVVRKLDKARRVTNLVMRSWPVVEANGRIVAIPGIGWRDQEHEPRVMWRWLGGGNPPSHVPPLDPAQLP